MKHRHVKFQSVLQGEHVGWLLDFIAHLMTEADEDRRETRCSSQGHVPKHPLQRGLISEILSLPLTLQMMNLSVDESTDEARVFMW